MSVNKQIIIGNLGKDPEVHTFPDGSKACRFTVAVTESAYTASNGQQVLEHTEWFNILCRGKRADVAAQYLHKGDRVFVEGKTYTGEYQDQQGMTRRYTEVRCEGIELLTPKSQQTQAPQQGYAQYQQAPAQPQYQQASQAPQYQQAHTQQAQPATYAPNQSYAPAQPQAPQQTAAPAAPPQMGVFGQPAQTVPVDQKPWP